MDQLLKRIPRSETEEVQIRLREFKGRRLFDVRVFFERDGEFHPTRKGVALPAERIAELREALDEARKVLDAEGT